MSCLGILQFSNNSYVSWNDTLTLFYVYSEIAWKYINEKHTLTPFTDGSLSDTAVGVQNTETGKRKPEQRSPKSESSCRDRERDRFGVGMGKKSNSTSQLSATGKCRYILILWCISLTTMHLLPIIEKWGKLLISSYINHIILYLCTYLISKWCGTKVTYLRLEENQICWD